MRGTLLLTILSIQSSYNQDIEQPMPSGEAVPDTIQWWIGEAGSWRIRTFGVDHDIHIYSVEDREDLAELVTENTSKHYGDITTAHHSIEFADISDEDAVGAAFEAVGLAAYFDVVQDRFLFWKPDDARYFTQSEPE